MFTVGLTGGIGSGKTTVVGYLLQKGAYVVDADQAARQIMEPASPALKEVEQAFPGTVSSSGVLDRAALACQAFASEEKTELLNQITTPFLEREIESRFEKARHSGAEIVIYDMPLLFERNQQGDVDYVVVVDAPEEVKIARVLQHRGLDEADVKNRMDRQLPSSVKAAGADTVLNNAGTLESLYKQIDDLWAELSHKHPQISESEQ